MDNIEFGKVVKLSNNKEYACACVAEKNDITYLYLVTTTKPTEVVFAKYNKGNETELTLIGNKKEKLEVYELFKDKIIN